MGDLNRICVRFCNYLKLAIGVKHSLENKNMVRDKNL